VNVADNTSFKLYPIYFLTQFFYKTPENVKTIKAQMQNFIRQKKYPLPGFLYRHNIVSNNRYNNITSIFEIA
jgi:hypothetical protein